MKVAELRKILSSYKKEEIIKLAVEFYKIVPKAKKEDYDLDALIRNPTSKKRSKSTKEISLSQIKSEVALFIENAREQNYLVPNRSVPKKERSTWRHKAKRWYKELTNPNRKDSDPEVQLQIITDLYELLCESCYYRYFTAYDTFESVGITQVAFFDSVLEMMRATLDPGDFVFKAIHLIVDNSLNRYTLYSELKDVFIGYLKIPDMKYRAVETAQVVFIQFDLLLKEEQAEKKDKYSSFSVDLRDYEKRQKHKNLVELVLRIYCSLYEYEDGISFFKAHYDEENPEVKLYILVRILFDFNAHQIISQEIELVNRTGIQPREKLLELNEYIKKHGGLPKYL